MSLKNITYLDLIVACQDSGCLACTLRQKMVSNYIRMLFHEHINDPPSRDKLRYSQGLCNDHLWLAIDLSLGNALGVAIIANDVLGKLINDLAQIESGDKRFGRLNQLLKSKSGTAGAEFWFEPERECPVCQHAELVEQRVLKTLIDSIERPELSEAIRQSEGICLPHLRRLLKIKAPAASQELLLELARQRWQSLRDELSEFIRKNDYRFSKEGFGAERDAWLRASALLTGKRPKKN